MKLVLAPIVLVTSIMVMSAADQGAIAYWSSDDLKSGRAANMPFMTATHAFNLLRIKSSDTRMAESHEGTTDVLFVVSGNGRATAGGRIDGAAALPNMPGELRGRSIAGGQNYALTQNAVINLPPSTPYLVRPTATSSSCD